MMIEVFKIDDNIRPIWRDVREFLYRALKKYGQDDRYPLDYLLTDLITGKMQLWVIIGDGHNVMSATVTEIVRYPLGDAVNIFLMGGEGMDEWGDLLHDALVKYAKEVNAKWIDTGSRRGIGKKFYDRLGYVRKQENYCYDLHSRN